MLCAGADFGGLISLYNEDCLQALKRYDDNHFDIAIVDPPYGIGISSNPFRQKFEKCDWDNAIPNKQYFDELMRVSKNQIIWGSNYFELPPTRCNLIWYKMQEFSGADFELAWTSFDKASKAFKMSRVEAYSDGKIHPCQKPIKLYEWILKNYANEGDLILDTHLGSGSIRIACQKNGYSFTGFELDKDYYEKQEKRFKDFVSQLRMF